MSWLFWPLIGALFGIAAAQHKGFSVAAGIIGGLLLGPLAFLMFFVGGVGGEGAKKKCPHCAEWIKADAKVCRHCGRDVAPPAKPAAVPGYGSGMRR